MTTVLITHEVENSGHWAKAWHKGAGSRGELMAKIGVTARTFREPNSPNSVGLLLDVPDMTKFQAFMESDEARQAMAEDGVKPETIRMVSEFTA